MTIRAGHLSIDVSLDGTAGSICGEIRGGERPMRPFSGRLELLNELTLWQDETERQVIEGSGDAPSRKEPE